MGSIRTVITAEAFKIESDKNASQFGKPRLGDYIIQGSIVTEVVDDSGVEPTTRELAIGDFVGGVAYSLAVNEDPRMTFPELATSAETGNVCYEIGLTNGLSGNHQKRIESPYYV